MSTPTPTPSTSHHRTASPVASDEQSGSDHHRQKRRRVEDTDEPQPSTILAQISTWEMPPDVAVPHPTSEESSPQTVDHTAPIELSDSDDPVAVSSHAHQGSSATAIATPGSPSQAPTLVAVPEPLSAYTCPICFSPPTNATLTPCGHVCCGPCLFTAVKATIRRNMVVAMDRAPAARCPVCRAEIPGWDGRGAGVIGLKMQVMYSL